MIAIRPATLDDVTYITSLGKREFEAIGFISASAYEGAIVRDSLYARPNNRIWIADADGDPVGFLYATPGRMGSSLKVVQVCVQDDARRLEFGSALVAEAERYADVIQRSGVSLRVATDLEASRFWEAEGYGLLGLEAGGKRRGRVLERRYKRLPCGLFEVTS